MKILIDTNIIVDVALMRQPFIADSDRVLVLSEEKTIKGYIFGSTFGDLYYILRKNRGKDWTILFLRRLISFWQVATVDDGVIRAALAGDYPDFEDAIQYQAAVQAQLDGIVTRNPKDFQDTTISIFSPQSLIEAIAPNQ